MGFDKRDNARPYTPQEGDTLQAIAEQETAAGNPVSWQDLARFNWGTDDPAEVNAFLRDELGARHRDADNNFVLASDDDAQGQLLIPVPFQRRGLALEQIYTLRVRQKVAPPQFLECCHLPGLTFAFDRSFIRPDVVGYLKKLEAVAHRHPAAKIMIFGHTDAVGDDVYNKKLSERRAWSVYAFITNDPNAWEVLYNHADEDWGLAVIQEILTDLGHDPGPIDGDWGPQTRAAMRSFLNLPEDAPVQNDAAFRQRLFAAYMASKHDIDLPPERFVDPGYMGCGEFNPTNDGDLQAQNRRVTFFFFHPERVPKLPCAFNNLAPCQKQIAAAGPRFKASFRCSFYDSLACDCGSMPPLPATVEILFDVIDATTQEYVPEERYQLISHDGACDHTLHCEQVTTYDDLRTVLRFENITPGLRYSLYQHMTPNVKVPLFLQVPFDALEDHGTATPDLPVLNGSDPVAEAAEPPVSFTSNEPVFQDHADDYLDDPAWYREDPHLEPSA